MTTTIDPCTYPKPACDILATLPSDRIAAVRGMAFRNGPGHGKDGYCVEEALGFLMGYPVINDQPECVCPVIRRGSIAANDSWVWESDAERTEALMDVMFAQVGSRSTPEVERARRYLAARFAIRIAAPSWLRRAKLEDEAKALEALTITPGTVEVARERVREARRADAAAAAAYAAYAYAAAAYAAYAADAAADAADDARLHAKALLTRYIGVLRAMCDVTPENAASITANDATVVQ